MSCLECPAVVGQARQFVSEWIFEPVTIYVASTTRDTLRDSENLESTCIKALASTVICALAFFGAVSSGFGIIVCAVPAALALFSYNVYQFTVNVINLQSPPIEMAYSSAQSNNAIDEQGEGVAAIANQVAARLGAPQTQTLFDKLSKNTILFAPVIFWAQKQLH